MSGRSTYSRQAAHRAARLRQLAWRRCSHQRLVPPVARQPRVVLGRAGQGAHLVPSLDVGVRRRLRGGRLLVVLGRTAQRVDQLHRPAPRYARRQSAIIWVAGRAGRLHAHHLPRPEAPGVPRGQRAAAPRRAQGRPRVRLPHDDARARLHDARLRAHRRRALGRLRRLLGGVAARSHRRCAVQGRGHGQRRPPRRPRMPLKKTVDRAIEGMSLVESVLVARRTDHRRPDGRRDATCGSTTSA